MAQLTSRVDYVGGAGSQPASLPDAPVDAYAYGRMDAAWVQVLPLTGGVLSGTLQLAGDPTQPLHAATKQYVDGLIGPINTALTAILGGNF